MAVVAEWQKQNNEDQAAGRSSAGCIMSFPWALSDSEAFLYHYRMGMHGTHLFNIHDTDCGIGFLFVSEVDTISLTPSFPLLSFSLLLSFSRVMLAHVLYDRQDEE